MCNAAAHDPDYSPPVFDAHNTHVLITLIRKDKVFNITFEQDTRSDLTWSGSVQNIIDGLF